MIGLDHDDLVAWQADLAPSTAPAVGGSVLTVAADWGFGGQLEFGREGSCRTTGRKAATLDDCDGFRVRRLGGELQLAELMYKNFGLR